MSHPRSINAGSLADDVGGKLVGDPERVIRRVATLDEADGDCLSWIGSEKLRRRAEASRAAVLLIPDTSEPLPDRTCILVADPDLAMCDVLRLIGPEPDRVPPGVDESARVAPDATVEGASIGPFAHVGARSAIGPGAQLHANVSIGSDVRIGRDCVLWPGVVVREGSTIGDRVIIHPNSVIGADGFGYLQRAGEHVKIPQVGSVVIEDDVEIGALTTIDRARSGETRIGRGTKIDNQVQIAHNVRIGPGCIIVAQVGIAGSARLGAGVVMAGRAGSSDHVVIGDGAQLAACSVAFSEIPPGSVVRGVPAIDHRRYLREQASVRKIGKWIDRVKSLVKRVDRLEQDNPPSPRGRGLG